MNSLPAEVVRLLARSLTDRDLLSLAKTNRHCRSALTCRRCEQSPCVWIQKNYTDCRSRSARKNFALVQWIPLIVKALTPMDFDCFSGTSVQVNTRSHDLLRSELREFHTPRTTATAPTIVEELFDEETVSDYNDNREEWVEISGDTAENCEDFTITFVVVEETEHNTAY